MGSDGVWRLDGLHDRGRGSVQPSTSLCQGQYNYAAQYAQTAQGTFVAKAGPVGSSCTPTGAPTGTSGTINGNTATVSLPVERHRQRHLDRLGRRPAELHRRGQQERGGLRAVHR